MRTFYFGESGHTITEIDKKIWTNHIGKNIVVKDGRYKIINVRFEEDLIVVTGEKI